MFFYISFLFIILFIVIIYFSKRKHPFWDKQNVDRTHTKEGIVSTTKPSLVFDTNYSIKKHLDIEIFIKFINKHFIKGYYYRKGFIDWYLNDSVIFTMCSQNQLIGSIVSKEILLTINKKIFKCGYVDYLTIIKKYRNKYLAPLLISHIIDYHPNNYIFLFKKEDKPLPFKYLSKFNYYIKDLSLGKDSSLGKYFLDNQMINTNHYLKMEIANKDNEIVYKKYKSFSNNFDISIEFSNLSDFVNYFANNKSIFTFYEKKNGEILNLYCFYLIDLHIDKKRFKILEILFFINPNFFNHLSYYLKKFNIDYISIAGLGNYRELTDKYQFSRGKTCYLHFYNYGILQNYQPQKILLPLP